MKSNRLRGNILIHMETFISKNPEQTKELAAQLCKNAKLILLSGELGSGKTTFTKGLGAQFGLSEKEIKSPSYTIIREYDGFMHADFYRLEQVDELILERIKSWDGIVVIEWPEIMLDLLPTPHLHLTIKRMGEGEREIQLISR